MPPLPSPPPGPPQWPHCGDGADPATDPVGCRGIHVPGHTACLAHITDDQRTAYLATLSPGADIVHSGTPFNEPLLTSLLNAVRDPTSQRPHLGNTGFHEAQFSSPAEFSGAQFSGHADFGGAQFSSPAWFDGAQFSGHAWFNWAQFSSRAQFDGAQFSSLTWFSKAQFGHADFGGAQFSSPAWFDGAQFSGHADFFGAQFRVMSLFGPVVCGQKVDLSSAVFEVPVTLEIAAREVRCVRTRFESTAIVRLRYARTDLSHAVLSSLVAVTAHPTSLAVDESLLAGPAHVRVASVQGVDAANLVLTDTDLTDCLFTGAFHLDQLRLEGRCTFAPVPIGLHHRGLWPVRWTRRRTLAEEHHWRAHSAGQSAPAPSQAPSPRAWRTGPHHPDPDLTADPEDVAATYRQLRKAFEDGKNEPGAADFYYGEMGAA
ncbi:pentapeptide repeat-containing protein [Streptomyces sp. NPDC002817]|uniref:pentapeptide repeat-containing protein n=1 Tax=Streptomyces sp. NPDC088357 TaxID=3154655 RepID=UPI003444D3FD